MGLIYYTFDDQHYKTLRLSGSGYPTGLVRGTFNSDVDPGASTAGWLGPWSSHNTDITSIIIEDSIDITYGQCLFYGMKNVQTLKGIDYITGGLINANRMFAGMSNLRYIYDSDGNVADFALTNIRSVNCTNMEEMFAGTCANFARRLDLSSLSTSNALTMKSMFEGSGFSVIDMQLCDTHSVYNSDKMFANCNNLTTIYGTTNHFDFSAATSSTDMFAGSPNIPNAGTKIDKTGAIPVVQGGHIEIQIAPQITGKVHIKLRYDTLANWTLYNPILMKGEASFDSTTKRIKVGDGVSYWLDLPYYGSTNVDNFTLGMDSEGMMFAKLDSETIYCDSEGIHAKQAKSDNITIKKNSSEEFYLDLDSETIEVNSSGKLSAKTTIKADGKTIVDNSGTFSVPIDNDTIYVSEGKLVAKGDVIPGKALDWDGTTRTLDVRYDDETLTLQGDGTTHGYLSVNYDGGSIWWNTDAAGTSASGTGALSGYYSKAGDGIDIVETQDGSGKKQTVSVKIDEDTIKLVDGKLTAQGKLNAGDAIAIDSENTIDVLVDNDTIVISSNKIKASEASETQFGVVKFDNKTIIKNSSDQLEVPIDDDTIKIDADGKIYATAQVPTVDSETIILDGNVLKVNKLTTSEFETFWRNLF